MEVTLNHSLSQEFFVMELANPSKVPGQCWCGRLSSYSHGAELSEPTSLGFWNPPLLVKN
jgi:hypothetical protein